MLPGRWFDVNGDGLPEPVSWTQAGSGAAWLVLDLDGDGAITTGAELFGVEVEASRRGKPTGGKSAFTLLAAYDDPANGGNGDGLISAADAVFGQLRLWIDQDHDGVSQPDELMPLDTAGVVSIELSYQITGRRDGVGNLYRYRGTVHLTSGRSVPIWDVFLATTDAATTQVAVHSPRGFAAAVGHRLVQVGAWVRRTVAPRTVSALTGTPPFVRLGRPRHPRPGGRPIPGRWRKWVRHRRVKLNRVTRIRLPPYRKTRLHRRRRSLSTTTSTCSARCAR